jgi:hypothetical protein
MEKVMVVFVVTRQWCMNLSCVGFTDNLYVEMRDFE